MKETVIARHLNDSEKYHGNYNKFLFEHVQCRIKCHNISSIIMHISTHIGVSNEPLSQPVLQMFLVHPTY